MNRRRVVLATLATAIAAGGASAAPVVYLGHDEQSGSSRAVVVQASGLAHTGQVMAVDKQGNLVCEGSVDTQLAQAIFNLEAALAAVNSGTEHLVKLNVYVDSVRTADRVRRMFAKRFPAPVRPAMSWVCTPLPHPKALVALDAVAVVPGDGPTDVLRKRCESFAGDRRVADVAVLPRGETVYVSGIPEKGDMASAAAKSLQKLMETIGHLDLERSQVVQVKAFLGSMGEAEVVRREVSKVFPGRPAPPVVLVEWTTGAAIEIEMIVAGPKGNSAASQAETVSYFTPPGVTASPVYSKVARVHGGKQIYISGLYAAAAGDGQAQVRSIFGQLQQIATEAGTDLRSLVKATYYVSDKDASSMLNKLRPDYYDPRRPPAASKAMVQGVGAADRSITLDMIAVTPK